MWGAQSWGTLVWGGASAVPLLGPSGLVCLVGALLLGAYAGMRGPRTRRTLLLGTMALVVVPLSAALAVTLPHGFTNGTIADADEVNANFAMLEAAANDADARLAAIESPEAKQTPTLLNGWVPYGSGWADPSYYIDGSGVVHLEGLVKDGNGNVIFILPVGYRPSGALMFATIQGGALARIDINPNTGEVALGLGSTRTFVSLSGIAFRP